MKVMLLAIVLGWVARGPVSAQYHAQDWADRDLWMGTERILKWAGVAPGEVVADIGCHEGYLSMHLSRAVGENGRVFAVDIVEGYLQELEENAADRGIDNITTVLGSASDPRLPANSFDAIFIIDAYHEMDNYQAILEHLANALKPGGRLVILEKIKDHAKGKSREEQANAHTLSMDYVKSEMEAAGFLINNEFHDLGKWERETDKTMWMLIGNAPAPATGNLHQEK